MKLPNPDLKLIRTIDGKQDVAFEEFCCQIARRDKGVPKGSSFLRYRGAGGDGGVECIWKLPNDEEWGWQAKFLFALNKSQIDKSFKTALSIHPNLTRYHICIPFDLTGPTGRASKKGQAGRSEYEKYGKWVEEWKRFAATHGREVEFILHDRSRLLDELMEFDSNLGRLRFWFDLERFGDQWFDNHLEDVITAADPRYNPKLTVSVPIYQAFEALGKTGKWQQTIETLSREVAKVSKQWTFCLKSPDLTDSVSDFPEAAKEAGDLLAHDLLSIEQRLLSIVSRPHGDDTTEPITITEIQHALGHASACLSIVEDDLEREHGSGVASSPGFRQFMAEHVVSFPARHVDSARDVIATLQNVMNWARDPSSLVPQSTAMLVLGPTGIGKTHSICDIAKDRARRGLRSIVLFGEDFRKGEPWKQITEMLGLSSNISRDELLSALDAAGEAAGLPLLIFIDALNETRPRDYWYKYLARLIRQVARYDSLRLCVSCRSTYYDEVIAPSVQIPEVLHTGFEGVEFDAAFEFFRFYELEAPSMPLMQPEFSNPLFLRLVCETLKESGEKRLQSGGLGITGLIDKLFEAKNAKIARLLDFHPKEKLVHHAMNALVGAMSSAKTDSLQWNQAKDLVDAIRPSKKRSTSLFDCLLKESLIREEGSDVIKLSFERLADHLVAASYLADLDGDEFESAFKRTGPLYFTIANSNAIGHNAGLLEALAVQIPEKYGVELTEAIDPRLGEDARLINFVLDSLMWRTSSSFTTATKQLVRRALAQHETFKTAMEALLAIGTRADNSLNALWFHKLHASIAMADRDAAICPFLHLSFGKRKGVDKLIRWALQADLMEFSDEVAELWATQLIWFCAGADRRVRDYATRAIVRVMEGHGSVWPTLISRFSDVDDEYVIERCLAAAYASLLRKGSDSEIEKVGSAIYRTFFENDDLPQNAMIRDYARLIMEFAQFRNVAPTNIKIEQVRPPYKSEWPLNWPDKDFETRYADSYDDFPKLFKSCMEDDFKIYTLSPALSGYPRDKLKRPGLWIFKHVLDMGYSKRLGSFDHYMLSQFGGGRSKETWAERVGKKYQWIAFYRLIARIADHLPRERSIWDHDPLKVPRLQALRERDLDPTVLREPEGREFAPTWRISTRYDFQRTEHLTDEAWLDTFDFPDSAETLEITNDDDNRRQWLLLAGNFGWRSKGTLEPEYPYRNVSMVIRSFLVPNDHARKSWDWLRKQNYRDVDLPEGYQLNRGFLAEYPWALPFAHYFEAADEPEVEDGETSWMMSATHILNIDFEFDAYQPSSINALLPAKPFFDYEKLKWDTRNTYFGPNGGPRFVTLPLTGDGPLVLLVEREFLNEFLGARGLTLLWGVRSEKHHFERFLASNGLGYAEYTRAHLFRKNKIKNAEPLIERIRPARS